MKKTLIAFTVFLMIIACITTSCDENQENESRISNSNVSNRGGKLKLDKNEDELYIYAKVENASKFSNVVEVKLMMMMQGIIRFELARGDWKGDGFTIVLPKTVDPNYLREFVNNNREYMTIVNPPSTVTISNTNVKVGDVAFVGVDKDGKAVTRFYPIEINEDGNGQDAYYTYVDSDVAISGYTEREGSIFAYSEYDNARYTGMQIQPALFAKITTTYSVKWEKGWNVWSFLRFVDSYIPGNITATEKWVPTCSSRLKWYSAEDLWIGTKEK